MAVDLFICPEESAGPITVDQIRQHFASAGLPCSIEMHDDPWIVFDGQGSDLVLTVEPDGTASSAVMQVSGGEDPEFGERVLAVFETFGWRCDEDSF
jgi:hypothetical protein